MLKQESIEGLSLSFKKELLKNFQNSVARHGDYSLAAQDSCLGLFDLLQDIHKHQKYESLFNKLYSVDDIFAPHMYQNLNTQVDSDQFSSSSTLRSEDINHSRAIKQDKSFVIEQLPDSTYQLRGLSFTLCIFPEFYHYPLHKHILVHYIPYQQFNYRHWTLLESILQELRAFADFLKHQIQRNQLEEPKNVWRLSYNAKGLVFRKELFLPYAITRLRYIFTQFQNSLQKKQIEWKINHYNFLNIVLRTYLA